MKRIHLLALMLATTFFSCQKDFNNEALTLTSETTPKRSGSRNETQSIDPAVLSYEALISNLMQRGYHEIDIPTDYVPQIKLSSYPGTVLHMYILQNTIVEVYKFPNAGTAATAAASNDCSYKENAGGGTQTAGCYESGSDCKIKVDTLNGTTTVTIVCC